MFKNVVETRNISIFSMCTIHIVIYMCMIQQKNDNNEYILNILVFFIMRGFDIMII